jgi:hypothetical protein
MTYKGKVRGKVIELESTVALPEGTEVEIAVKGAPRERQALRDHPRGSPQAILKFLDSPPVCTPDDVEALLQAIEQGKRPPRFEGIFDKV